jgi:hypothetical protein
MAVRLQASLGGDQRSPKTDSHADRIAALLAENGDVTLV